MSSLKQIFYDCQFTAASHPKQLKQLVKIYIKSDPELFTSEFTSLLKRSLIHGDKQLGVERTLNFVAKFATAKKEDPKPSQAETETETEDDEDSDEADLFLVDLIKFLLNNHEANSQAVRFRVCQLINKILNQMGEEAVIDDDLYSIIYDTMLHRLQDKIPAVRVQAILALARLQDPRNKECPVIKAYRYHLSMDPNADVRRAVLTSTAINFPTLPDILDRTRDVRDTVRREAFKVISQKVHIRSLTIAHRVRLISEGLKDRSDMVRTVVEKSLLQSWLRMVNSSVLSLLSCLDVEASVEEAELALKTMFRDVPYTNLVDNFGLLREERIVSLSELRPESALYWRCLAQHLTDESADEILDTIIPELSKFCTYVHEYSTTEVMDTGDPQETAVQCMEREFVTSQLIKMIMMYDLSDEVGRRSLDKLVRTLLVSDKMSESLVKGLVEVFGRLHPPTTRMNQLAEIISEVREPDANKTVIVQPISDEEKRKKKLQDARIRVRMNQVREEIEESARALDFGKAQTLKEELEELETELSLVNIEVPAPEDVQQTQEELSDPPTLRKCLMIVCHMLENPDITEMTPTLYSLHENLILPCLRCEDPTVRNQAVRSLGLMCLLSLEHASQHLVLFLQISRIDIEQIKLTALRCLIDILHLYGLEEFTEAAEDIGEVNESKESNDAEEEGGVIVSALCQMMESESTDVRTHAAEGLCKLLLACRITSSKLLSHLILMWYNPATDDDSLLRHMLGVFFPLYASYGGTNQESLAAAVLPTLQTLFHAPLRSPLADVDVDDVANFLVSITSPGFATEASVLQVNTHDTLVFTLCTDILANPDSSHVKVLIRCLNHLNLTPTNYSTLRQVKVLTDKMVTKVKERASLNGVDRFIATVQNYLKNAPEPVLEEEEDDDDDDGKLTVEKSVDKSVNESAIGSPIKLSETAMIRKKRMLYNLTSSDMELFSSEAESEGESSPSVGKARHLSPEEKSEEISEAGSPVVRSTAKEEEEGGTCGTSLENPVVCRPVGDSELEVSPKIADVDDTKKKDNKKRSKNERTSTSEHSSEEEVKTPSKAPRTTRGSTVRKEQIPAKTKNPRRRSKKQMINVEESSEGEKAVPSKVAKTLSAAKKIRVPVIRITRLSDSVFRESTTESEPSIYTTAPSSMMSSEGSVTSTKDGSLDGDALPAAKTARKNAGELEDSNSSSDETLTSSVSVGSDETLTSSVSAGERKPTRSSASSKMRSVASTTESSSVEDTPKTRKRAPRSGDTSSQSVREMAETASSKRKPTRSSPLTSTDDATPQNRRSSARKGAVSSSTAQRNLARRGESSADDSKSSRMTLSSSQTTTTSEDVTPVRRSARKLISSQSTDSDSEETPGRLRTRLSSSRKDTKLQVTSTKRGRKKK